MEPIKMKRPAPGIVFEQSMFGWGQGLTGKEAGEVVKGWSNALSSHEVLAATSIAAAFIPVIGLALSSGIMLMDAAKYYKEGDRLNAGTMAVFALLPGIGTIASKIPGMKKLGSYGMALLGKKLATSKNPVLNKIEMAVVKDMTKHSKFVKTEMNSYFKARVANELTRTLQRNTASGSKKILMRIADGTLKASVAGAKIGSVLATYNAADKTWNSVYKKLGFDKLDKLDYEFKGLDDLEKQYASAKHRKNENMKSNKNSEILTNIIKASLLEQGVVLDKDVKVKQQSVSNNNNPPQERKTVSRGTWIIIFLLVGLVGGTGLLYKLSKFLYKKGVSLVYILKGGKIRDVIKRWGSKGGVKSAKEAIEEMYENKKIDSKQRQELLDALENPAITRELEREFFNLSKSAFERGEITADEFLATLEPQARKKYESIIRKIEKERGVGKPTKTVKTTTTKTVRTTTAAQAFKPIKPVTEKVFNNTIIKNLPEIKKRYSIQDVAEYTQGHGTLYVRIQRLKQQLTNAAQVTKRFKQTVTSFEEYVKLCKENNLPLSDNILDQKRAWEYYWLKQLFK